MYEKLVSALTNNSFVKGISRPYHFHKQAVLRFSLAVEPVCTKEDCLFLCWNVLQVLIVILLTT